MTTPATDTASGRDKQERLAAFLAEAGYVPTATPVLQPVEVFLELSGEDIRRRIFVTQDQAGRELCLRPEFTIPICRLHQARGRGASADYSYLGPVFRLAEAEPSEFLQAGIESVGREDIAAADAEILGFAVEGLALLDRTDTEVRFSDMGLTVALLDALAVPAAAKRRTLRALAARRSLDDIVALPAGEDPNAGLLAAIQGQDPAAARAFVENILSIAGISRVGGRSAGDIAQRFLAKATANAGGNAGLNPRNRGIVERYRAIEGSPDDALDALRGLVREAEARSDALSAALDLFEERLGFMEARGLPVRDFRFSGGFARNLDYYTGFIFEIGSRRRGQSDTLVGGGRYDGLLSHLGSETVLPAVGCAFWLDRIVASGERHV